MRRGKERGKKERKGDCRGVFKCTKYINNYQKGRRGGKARKKEREEEGLSSSSKR